MTLIKFWPEGVGPQLELKKSSRSYGEPASLFYLESFPPSWAADAGGEGGAGGGEGGTREGEEWRGHSQENTTRKGNQTAKNISSLKFLFNSDWGHEGATWKDNFPRQGSFGWACAGRGDISVPPNEDSKGKTGWEGLRGVPGAEEEGHPSGLVRQDKMSVGLHHQGDCAENWKKGCHLHRH